MLPILLRWECRFPVMINLAISTHILVAMVKFNMHSLQRTYTGLNSQSLLKNKKINNIRRSAFFHIKGHPSKFPQKSKHDYKQNHL